MNTETNTRPDALSCQTDTHTDTEIEAVLRQAAAELPGPRKNVPVLSGHSRQASKNRLQQPLRRVAVLLLAFLLLSSGTAAASPNLRQAVIRFFTSGTRESIPSEQLSEAVKPDHYADTDDAAGSNNSASSDNSAATNNPANDTIAEPDTAAKEKPLTAGSVTLLQNQVIDEHFTASYLSSPDYLDVIAAPSGRLLFYTSQPDSAGRTYYCVDNGTLQASTPDVHSREGSISLKNLPGVMSRSNDTDYRSIKLPEMKFTVDWQQYEDEILPLNTDSHRFDIGSTFGGSQDGKPLTDAHDGLFYANAIPQNTSWVEVHFLYDPQVTEYSYPFLFNIRTGETKDPLAGIDLSAYACITGLQFCDNQKTATAMAGQDYSSLHEISIDLASGAITETAALAAPVSDCFLSMATGSRTVFYTTGTQEHMDGYLYDAANDTTTELFQDAAWGYTWEYGFADTYVSLIGGNYAALYREPENKVYLLNLSDGSRQLLDGIPASHDVSFFWNPGYQMLSISILSEQGTSRLAFFIPGTDKAWYFDRELPDGIMEESSSWYGDYGYCIQAASEDGKQHYLYLYEYTPN